MDIRRLLHNPDDGGWFVIGETKSEAEMNDFRRSLKRNAIINTHLVNCTMNHENVGDANSNNTEHKMKVQWTKCTSALCHPKGQDGDDDDEGDQDSDGSGDNNNQHQHTSTTNNTNRKSRAAACPVQLRMSTCQLTFVGIVCQAYQHLSEEHDSAEPLQSCVTEDMKTHIVRMLQANRDVKPMVIFKELLKIHRQGAFGADLMPTKIQLRNALTYLRSRKLKLDDGGGSAGNRSSNNNNINDNSSRSSLSSSTSSSRKRTFDSFSEGSASPPCDEHRQPE